MTAIPPISMSTFLPMTGPSSATSTPDINTLEGGAPKTSGFDNVITRALDNVNGLQAETNDLAVKAATGDLTDIHDYTIAAQKSSLALELTVAVRNKALEAYQEVMRMGV